MDVPRANTGRAASSIPIKVSHKTSLPTSPRLFTIFMEVSASALESEHEIITAGRGYYVIIIKAHITYMCENLGQW